MALSSLQAERLGLGRRVAELQAYVGSLYGTEDGYYQPREQAQERELAEAEARMTIAMDRLKKLDDEIGRFRKMEGFVQGVTDGDTNEKN